MPRSKNISIVLVISLAVLIVVAGYTGVGFLTDYFKYDRYNKRTDFIDPSTYQSVVLTNNQVYFGRLKSVSDDYLILSDVYYIKIESDGNRLIKLGTIESHGPQDKMTINQDQVMFWENLRSDSQVVKTIQGM